MAQDEARKRLAEAMEARRDQLGITWRQVAAAGGTTYETLRAVRQGTNEITPPTRRAIEAGLHWPGGYVDAILADEAAVVLRRMIDLVPSIRRRFGDDRARAVIDRIKSLGQEADLADYVADELRRQSG